MKTPLFSCMFPVLAIVIVVLLRARLMLSGSNPRFAVKLGYSLARGGCSLALHLSYSQELSEQSSRLLVCTSTSSRTMITSSFKPFTLSL